MTQEDLTNGLEADGVVRDTGAGNNNSRNDNPAGNSGDGAPADDVAQPSQAELVRQFGDEFRRSMQAAIGGKPIGWKHHECSPGRNSSPAVPICTQNPVFGYTFPRYVHKNAFPGTHSGAGAV